MGIVDLSHPVGHGTTTYPGLPGPVISDHLSRAESRTRYAPGYEFQIGRIDMVANTGIGPSRRVRPSRRRASPRQSLGDQGTVPPGRLA